MEEDYLKKELLEEIWILNNENFDLIKLGFKKFICINENYQTRKYMIKNSEYVRGNYVDNIIIIRLAYSNKYIKAEITAIESIVRYPTGGLGSRGPGKVLICSLNNVKELELESSQRFLVDIKSAVPTIL